MYESLREWINVPITVKPFEKRTGSGDKLFGKSYDTLAYPVYETKVVRNKLGVDVESNQQLYVDGSERIAELDEVTFDGQDLPVQAIRAFYRNGVPDIKVVFL